MLRKMYCVLISALLLLSCSVAGASQIVYDEGADEYCIVFGGDSVERITASGYFTFRIESVVESNKFTLSSTKTKITAEADATDSYGLVYPNKDIDYTIELWQPGLISKPVASVSGSTWSDISSTVTGLKTDKKYYLRVSVDSSSDGYFVEGSGHLSNIDEVF